MANPSSTNFNSFNQPIKLNAFSLSPLGIQEGQFMGLKVSNCQFTNDETCYLLYIMKSIAEVYEKNASHLSIDPTLSADKFNEHAIKTYTEIEQTEIAQEESLLSEEKRNAELEEIAKLNINLTHLVTSLWDKTKAEVNRSLTEGADQQAIDREAHSQAFALKQMQNYKDKGRVSYVFTRKQIDLLRDHLTFCNAIGDILNNGQEVALDDLIPSPTH